MMADEHLLREKHRMYNQVFSETPLFDPAPHVMGEKNRNIIPVRPKFDHFSARMLVDRGVLVCHGIESGHTGPSFRC